MTAASHVHDTSPHDFATRLATAFMVLVTLAAVGCEGDAPGGSLLGRTLLTGPERSTLAHGDWDDVDNAVAVAAAKTEMAIVDQSTDENGDRVYELLTIADEPARIRVRRVDPNPDPPPVPGRVTPKSTPDRIQVSAKVGRMGNPGLEKRLIGHIKDRLSDLAGVDYAPVR